MFIGSWRHLKRAFVSLRCLSLQPYRFAFALVQALLMLLWQYFEQPSSPCGASPCGRMGSHWPPLFGHHLPFCSSTSHGGMSTSHLHLAFSCAQGTNALGLVVTAFSALLAGSMLVVLLVGAGAAPVTGNTPPCSCVSVYKGLTSFASVFATVNANPRLSGSPGLPKGTGKSSDGDAPPDFVRSSTCKLGGFKCFGPRSSVVCHSVAAPSPGRFSRTRVSGGRKDKGEDKEI